MPTLRGWTVAVLGVGLIVTGRAFGASALEQTGFALVVLVALAVGVVRLRSHALEVDRTISPERAGSGRPVTVTLRIANRGKGAAPLMLLQDRVPAALGGHSRFTLPGLEPGGEREASFTLRPRRRGRYEIGPLEVAFVDPFGLAQVAWAGAGVSGFLVHPRIEPLALPRDLGQQRSLAVSTLRQPTGSRGDDFYTLREYAEGDDLRKIHWPSTAKRQRYMLRQEETAWHTRATILLDDRLGVHDGFEGSSSFERAVDAAASLVALYHRSGYSYRLACCHDPGLPSARGGAHFNDCLDLLAMLNARRDDRDGLLLRVAEMEAAKTAEGTLVAITGSMDAAAAAALSRCRRMFRQVIVISFPAHRYGQASTRARWEGEQTTFEAMRLLARAGARTIVLSPDEALATGWGSLSQPRSGGGEAAWAQKPELV